MPAPVLRLDIVGFDELFVQAGSGFQSGSTILITGPPGAGKTTFALAAVRSAATGFLQDHRLLRSPTQGETAIEERVYIYYISLEIDRPKLERMYTEKFGWFGEGDRLFTDQRGGIVRFRIISPRVEIDRPARTSEEMINIIFSRIREDDLSDYAEATEGGSPKVFVIIDSITALLKDCGRPGEERRQTHELLHRVKTAFPSGAVQMTFILSEVNERMSERAHSPMDWDSKASPSETHVPIEDYLVDIVFRLYLRAQRLGGRLRILEITKSQGTHMVLGEHTWAIATPHWIDEVVRLEALREDISKQGLRSMIADHGADWGTIVIFPSPRLLAARRSAASPTVSSADSISSGTVGLDELLDHTIASKSPSERKAIKPGTISLVIGPAGSGTTTLCFQFLSVDDGRALYISFDPAAYDQSDRFSVADRRIEIIHRPRVTLDVNVLTSEIRRALQPNLPTGITRVAIDGISDWITSDEPDEIATILETLLWVIRDSCGEKRPTIFIAYETQMAGTPLAPDKLSIGADNIIILRHVNINDGIRRIVFVVKSFNRLSNSAVRELVSGETLMVRHALDGYTGLLTNQPKRARIVLQLFHENRAEKAFNRWARQSLEIAYDYSFDPFSFSRSEIESTLADATAETRIPAADLKLLTVDEWWIGQERHGVISVGSPRAFAHPLLPLSTTSRSVPGRGFKVRDFWVFELEKATLIVRDGRVCRPELYALPMTLDVGILCINVAAIQVHMPGTIAPPGCLPGRGGFSKDLQPQLRTFVDAVQKQVPRTWADINNAEWFEAGPGTLSGFLKKCLKRVHDNNSQDALWGFAFDTATMESAVCAYFEFAWSFGATEDFLIRDVPACARRGAQSNLVSEQPALRALRFLQFLVVEGIMPARCTLDQTRHAILSRQFFSTRRYLHETFGPTRLHLLRLPFLPIGAFTAMWVTRMAADSIRRFRQLLDRLLIVVHVSESGLKEVEEFKGILINLTNSIGTGSEAVDEADGICDALADPLATLTELPGSVREFLKRVTKDIEIGIHCLQERLENPIIRSLLSNERTSDGIHESVIQNTLMLMAAAEGMDVRDVDELLTWSRMRVDMLKCILERTDLKAAHMTAFPCSGSWMLGVHHSTQSPSLARDLLKELSSLSFAEKRAEMGAGIPARKDFITFHGDEIPRDSPGFTWIELFRQSVFNVRRRDRVMCSRANAPEVYHRIHAMIKACLDAAGDVRARGQVTEREVNYLKEFARLQLDSLHKFIAGDVKHSNATERCRTCPFGVTRDQPDSSNERHV